MLPLVTSLYPAPQVNVPSQQLAGAQALANLASGTPSVARQQVQNAVLATGAPAAFSPQVREWKQSNAPHRIAPVAASLGAPTSEETINLPALAPTPSSAITLGIPLSSQLAAQIFAQASISEGELPVVILRDQKAEAKPVDMKQVVRDIRVAQGEVDAARAAVAAKASEPSALVAAINMAISNANSSAQLRQLMLYAEVLRPPIGRRPGIADAKGADAYQIAQARNAAIKSENA